MTNNMPKKTSEFSFPALGNAMGYFITLYLIAELPWLDDSDESFAVAAMGTIMIHVLQGARFFYLRITNKGLRDVDGQGK